jgi:hypothetical protein
MKKVLKGIGIAFAFLLAFHVLVCLRKDSARCPLGAFMASQGGTLRSRIAGVVGCRRG